VTTPHTDAFERVLGKLKKVKRSSTDKNKARALCPAHDGDNPTALAITRIEGSVLLYCHVGCHIDDILASLEMRRSDLYDDQRGYDYKYADGATAHRSYGPDGKKRFYQSGTIPGAQTTLYRADRVGMAKLAGQAVYLVEGENDVHALETLGVTATTARGGADGIGKADLTPLHGAKVIAVVDKDEAGDKWARHVNERLVTKATLSFVQAEIGKDASDHIAAGKGIADFKLYYIIIPPVTTDEEREAALSRWLYLDEYLDGSYTPPQPSVGAARDDDLQLLYPGRWHTVIGLMTAGNIVCAMASQSGTRGGLARHIRPL
jgi:5S rRNA maturation endonuclease (ribonuclease M5)